MSCHRITQVSGSLSKGECLSFKYWIAGTLLTGKLPPFSGLELVFTDVLIWNKFVPYMAHLQAQNFLAPFLWWCICKLVGNGTKGLQQGAAAGTHTQLWPGAVPRAEQGWWRSAAGDMGKAGKKLGTNGCQPSCSHRTTAVHRIVYFICHGKLIQANIYCWLTTNKKVEK